MNLKKEFCKETGIDLTDYEYAGVFPYYKKGGKNSTVSRGEGWKRYAEWLEQRLESGRVDAVVSGAKLDNVDIINIGNACWWESKRYWEKHPKGEHEAKTISEIIQEYITEKYH